MINPVIDYRIFTLNEFIQEVNYINSLMEHSELNEDDLEDLSARLSLSYYRLQTHKTSLKAELKEYFKECENLELPIYINYYRVYKEL